jgi:WD40 repeat protein
LGAIALSPDGKRLFYNGIWRLGLIEVSTGKSVLPRPDYGDYLSSLAISPDGRLLAIGAERELSIWNAKELKELLG